MRGMLRSVVRSSRRPARSQYDHNLVCEHRKVACRTGLVSNSVIEKQFKEITVEEVAISSAYAAQRIGIGKARNGVDK
jgi:hypothetical protein